jgi:hypothetical protein
MLINSPEHRAVMCELLVRIRNQHKRNGTYREWLQKEMQCRRYVRSATRAWATQIWRDIENAYKETQLQNPAAAKPA